MTAIAVRRLDVAPPLVAGLALAAAVVARWAVASSTGLDPVAVGLAFGTCLLLVARGTGWKPRSVPRPTILAGLAGGAVLVSVTLVVRASMGVGSGPGAVSATFPFLPWAIATCLVAAGEEAILRGVLFDGLGTRLGLVPAVLATSAAFALMHVPLYGWQVVPLDFGVGLWFAGLRLLTGSIGAPVIAHAIADLATYWL
jgi:membrane protease YdiL (CAAX protease family)